MRIAVNFSLFAYIQADDSLQVLETEKMKWKKIEEECRSSVLCK